jgi:hypothetical protein
MRRAHGRMFHDIYDSLLRKRRLRSVPGFVNGIYDGTYYTVSTSAVNDAAIFLLRVASPFVVDTMDASTPARGQGFKATLPLSYFGCWVKAGPAVAEHLSVKTLVEGVQKVPGVVSVCYVEHDDTLDILIADAATAVLLLHRYTVFRVEFEARSALSLDVSIE